MPHNEQPLGINKKTRSENLPIQAIQLESSLLMKTRSLGVTPPYTFVRCHPHRGDYFRYQRKLDRDRRS
ncbi:MAG TPA: hypothetical protein DEG17_05840 [Cyanobacteria bacterium UBA11149]|nr:hypothetical protein [Cyanobacteria bacterium UBA11367]HBE57465.1 hypothetical protein [Cyanobacteria bacterium UBA11366]HBK64529.1 hypothetical protein [Cyanobacteria bacterium UBA11166]HBR74185.1 hypothetical protein [Cyanobacteria bacterium UBA11159]HBS68625.1 hypothetical protein [Cyanobacteria bacterium UBA11153]HBW88400.1 hypothetical protein [Cyanobacteria bacterium UBA11149]